MQETTIAVEGTLFTVWGARLAVEHGHQIEADFGGRASFVQGAQKTARLEFYVEIGLAGFFGPLAYRGKPLLMEAPLFGRAHALVDAVADVPVGDSRPCFSCGQRRGGYLVQITLLEVAE